MMRILALGDSLTTGYGLAPDASFASRLEQALRREGRDVRVIDGGVSGDTAHDGLRRLGSLLAHQPHLVLVEFGTNDWYQGVAVDEIKANLEQIITTSHKAGARVLLAGVRSLTGGDEEYVARFHGLYQEIAREQSVPLVPDFLPGIVGNMHLTLPDGLHPNEAGVGAIVAAVLPVIRPVLDELEAGA
ncbi:MAG: arylesterase [Desulfovibrionales bacterium]|nr:MAG: arylesterase [Desulfovibrionales bacterium]